MRGRFEVTDLGNGYADGGGWVRFARRGRMSAFGRESPRGREAGQGRGDLVNGLCHRRFARAGRDVHFGRESPRGGRLVNGSGIWVNGLCHGVAGGNGCSLWEEAKPRHPAGLIFTSSCIWLSPPQPVSLAREANRLPGCHHGQDRDNPRC